MKLKEGIIIIVILTFVYNCESLLDSNKELHIPQRAYKFICYDSTGVKINRGWLKMEISDSADITGEWRVKNIQHNPFGGKGDLKGGFDHKRLWLNLYPGFIDNNIFLSGELEDNIYSGEWSFVTIAGVTDYGTFEAIKK